MGTGKEQHITIQNATNLSDKEVERMKAEAEKNAEEDKRKKDFADKRNEAETFVFTTRKVLKDAGDKFEAKAKEEIEAVLKDLEDEVPKRHRHPRQHFRCFEKSQRHRPKTRRGPLQSRLRVRQKEEPKSDEKPDEKSDKTSEKPVEEGEVVE